MFLQTAFTTQKDFGREAREAAWAKEQRTLHGLPTMEHTNIFHERHTFRDVSMMAEEARRRAEIARLISFSSLDIFSSSFLHTNNIYIELKYIYLAHVFWEHFLTLVLLFFLQCRLRELHTLKGKVESYAKLRGLDIEVNPHYTV